MPTGISIPKEGLHDNSLSKLFIPNFSESKYAVRKGILPMNMS